MRLLMVTHWCYILSFNPMHVGEIHLIHYAHGGMGDQSLHYCLLVS